MRAFVTGGAGFIGSHLVDRLLQLGHEVTIYDLVANGTGRVGLTLNTGDLLDTYRLTEAMRGHDVVFHFAANADVRFGTNDTKRDLNQNLIATSNVLEAMRQNTVRYIVFSSTAMVYGRQWIFPTAEDCAFPIQTSLYGASKIAAEGLISAYCHAFNMNATIFRFVPVLGERYRHGHVYDFYNKLKSDPNHIEILGNGKQTKSYVYVADCIDAIEIGFRQLTDKPVRIYNVSNRESYSVNQSLDVICTELCVHPVRTYTGGEGGWIGDPPIILLDSTRLRLLGWQPKVTIKEAILRTVRSFHD